jgi:hypothetical protein
LANGSGSVSGIGTIENGGTTGGGGARASIVHGVHYPYFTQLWNFFVSYSGITKGLGLRS